MIISCCDVLSLANLSVVSKNKSLLTKLSHNLLVVSLSGRPSLLYNCRGKMIYSIDPKVYTNKVFACSFQDEEKRNNFIYLSLSEFLLSEMIMQQNQNRTSLQNILGRYFNLIRFQVSLSSKPNLIKPGTFNYLLCIIFQLY